MNQSKPVSQEYEELLHFFNHQLRRPISNLEVIFIMLKDDQLDKEERANLRTLMLKSIAEFDDSIKELERKFPLLPKAS